MRSIFILVPSPHPTGPVKGACALANALVPSRRVVLVFLKPGPGVDAALDDRIERVTLAEEAGGWRGRLAAYRAMLVAAGGRSQVASISMCFSADTLNRFCRTDAVTCASVRGNLPQNYRHDYGAPGLGLAVTHLWLLRSFDHVVAMTGAMARQIRMVAGVRAEVIGNFVDEASLDPFQQRAVPREGPLRAIFVGSLSRRKQPELLVEAMEGLIERGGHLDLVGDGPLRPAVQSLVQKRGWQRQVHLHGQVTNPYPLVASADAFVLPSRSEGLSRAALEALYLGVPCVLRDVDGNGELVANPEAGALFCRDADLGPVLTEVVIASRKRDSACSLLPPAFRQEHAAQRYRELMENTL